jgi:hypothetical protein
MNTVVGIVAIIAGGLCAGTGSVNARLAEFYQRDVDIECREITALERFSMSRESSIMEYLQGAMVSDTPGVRRAHIGMGGAGL